MMTQSLLIARHHLHLIVPRLLATGDCCWRDVQHSSDTFL